MSQYWIAVDGNITIITTTPENNDKIVEALEGKTGNWDWGYFENINHLDPQQTKQFAQKYLADDEDLSSD